MTAARPGVLLALVVLLPLVLTGCGSARRGPPAAAEWERTDPTIRLGREVFDRACHLCHPGGETGLGFALNDKPLPGWLIKLQVRRGFGSMPAFSRAELSDPELDAVVAYLGWRRRATPGAAVAAP